MLSEERIKELMEILPADDYSDVYEELTNKNESSEWETKYNEIKKKYEQAFLDRMKPTENTPKVKEEEDFSFSDIDLFDGSTE